MTFLQNLHWRHATKAFDASKSVSDADLAKLKEAMRMAPTSFGLQPWHVKVVTDTDTKAQIRTVAWDQAQVTDSSHLLVFCARTDVANRTDQYFEIATGGNADLREKMKGYEDLIRGFFADKDETFVYDWARNQAYIAHGFALAACAELQIDSCPMEGFDPAAVDKILDLPSHLQSVVMLPIGYRSGDPEHAKVRYPESDLFS